MSLYRIIGLFYHVSSLFFLFFQIDFLLEEWLKLIGVCLERRVK